jgi:hypothetical protein
MTKPIWITPTGLLGTFTESIFTSTSVQATGASSYSLISGRLPFGLNISSTGTIAGTPVSVLNTIKSKFVIRATNNDGVADRTFTIDIQGPTDPVWSTPEGYLPMGYYGEGYAMNKQYIEYDLAAQGGDPTDAVIKYYIGDTDGDLPNGVRLSQQGKISGFIDLYLSPDAAPILYQFYVTATDGVITSRRLFKFYVVNPNIFRADSDFWDLSTKVITTTTTDDITNTGTIVLSVPGSLSTATDFSVIKVNHLINANSPAITTNTKIISVGTDSITLSTATTDIMVTGTILTISSSSEIIDILNVDVLSVDVGYLQPPQFLNGTDLGIVKTNNNDDISAAAYDAAPWRGPLTYTFVTGTTTTTQLPPNLLFDPDTGYFYGTIAPQLEYSRTYSLTVKAIKGDYIFTTSFVTATNTFTLTVVQDNVQSALEWVTAEDLGWIEQGSISMLSIQARQLINTSTVTIYNLSTGTLPPDLTLNSDGTIIGTVAYGSTSTYVFTATAFASPVSIEREFTLRTYKDSNNEFTRIYCRPFLSRENRAAYQTFITNTTTFDSQLIYRPDDPNFGVQTDIRMYLEFGIQKLDLERYTVALRENFYRKRFYFGDVKKAIAKNAQGDIVYEIVYIQPVDDMTNNQGVSATKVIYQHNEIYYPASIDNMRTQFRLIPLEDDTYINVNDNLLPKFMNTPQDEFNFTGYIPVIPICYALPGQADRLISRIKLSQFNFKQLDFEMDRIIVEDSVDSATAKYLLLERQSLSDRIETDNYLFGSDFTATWYELTVRLDDENDDPLIRT